VPVARVLLACATARADAANRAPQVPSFLPSPSGEERGGERFEKAVLNETAQADSVLYGLNKRSRPDASPPPAPGAPGAPPAAPRERSFVERALEERRTADRDSLEAEQLREDLQSLPDSAALSAYDAMPVESFGEAMLRGMGWTEGGPVGRNSKAVVKPVEYVPRPQLLGLGAQTAPAEQLERQRVRPGEARAPREHLVLPVGPDGRVRNVRTVDEALVARVAAGVALGKRMVVLEGPHAGLFGCVLALEKRDGRSDKATLRLELGGASVSLRCRDLADVGSREADDAAAKRTMPPPPAAHPRAAAAEQSAPQQQHSAGADASADAPWLAPHVRVRVVSQRLGDGRLYLKKGVIVDVTTPRECTLQLDDGGALVDGVPQHSLETVLPKKAAGRLLVVSGKLRGSRATLVSKDGGQGTAHVRLAADLAVVTLPLDALAEYTGPMDEHD